MSLRSTTVDYEAPKELKQRAVKHASALATGASAAHRLWAGKSGRLYRFTVHSLINCPAPGAGAYVLVKRNGSAAVALHVGIATSTAPTLNLAHIRRRGAQLGAVEVHFCGFAGSTAELRRIVRDLRNGLER